LTPLGQVARRELRNVDKLRWGFACGGESVAEHGVAEGAGRGDGGCAGGYKFSGAVVADAFAGLFAEECKASAGSAAETALVVAWGFDELAGLATMVRGSS